MMMLDESPHDYSTSDFFEFLSFGPELRYQISKYVIDISPSLSNIKI